MNALEESDQLALNVQAKAWIDKLGLRPHPEGGYFSESYRSNTCANFKDYKGKRAISTAIYYLLESGQISKFHTIKSDELWHYYAGSSLILHTIAKVNYGRKSGGQKTRLKKTILGIKGARAVPQALVAGDSIVAASVLDKKTYSLVGCTVAPGFDFEDWKKINSSDLVLQNPHLRQQFIRYKLL